MATFYLDFDNGDDTKDGTTFANRWKTLTSGATAARIAPGDVIRMMASPTPTQVDSGAVWTNQSKTVTLSGAVTANIDLCETAWTASANVTATAATTSPKEGSKYASLAIASAFTTGLVAYKAFSATDFSGYQQVSFWIQANAVLAASVLQIKLCSDNAGVTAVNTINIPAINGLSQWTAFTVDTGGTLGNSIQSVALYAASDPGTVTVLLDNILACKASSSADSLTLNSLIGKKWQQFWAASTAYATNDIVRPTPPNRNGFRYKVTAGGGGNSNGSEPTWPQGVGLTVTDGALTWTCEGLEDTWHGIQSINGTTVLLDADTSTTASQGRGYWGATETVATYKFQPLAPFATPATSGSVPSSIQDSGTDGSLIRFIGGFNRTDMSTQTGETWLDLRNGYGMVWSTNSKNYISFENLGMTRAQYGGYTQTMDGVQFKNCHFVNCFYGLYVSANANNSLFSGVIVNNCSSAGITNAGMITGYHNAIGCHSTRNGSGLTISASYNVNFTITDLWAKNNSAYGVNWGAWNPARFFNAVIADNVTAGMTIPDSDAFLVNCSIAESTEFASQTAKSGRYIYSQDHDQTPGNHLITSDGGTIIAATDQRNTASGIAWKFRPTSTNRNSIYPLQLSIAKVACKANVAINIAIYTRRDSTNIKGRLLVRGGQIAGVPIDVYVDCTPSTNTWAQSSTLTFTPTAAGVVEVVFLVWDGVGTTNNFWIDDLAVS